MGLPSALRGLCGQLFPDAYDVIPGQRSISSSVKQQTTISRDDWESFLTRLARCDHRAARLAGRIELVIWRWHLVDRNTPRDQVVRLDATANALALEIADYALANQSERVLGRHGTHTPRFDEARWLIHRHATMDDPFAPRRQLVPQPLRRSPQPPRKRTDKTPDSRWTFGRVRLEFVDIERLPDDANTSRLALHSQLSGDGPLSGSARLGQLLAPNSHDQWVCRWLACGERLDVVWSPVWLGMMHQPGKFETLRIATDKHWVIDDVRWDGEHLWAATLGQGVWKLDTSGGVVAHVGHEHGLPPSEHGIRALPVDGNRLLVVGSFGKTGRGWCAMVQFANAEPTVNVFHEARQVHQAYGETLDKSIFPSPKNDDADGAFIPSCLVAHRVYDSVNRGHRDVALVGRGFWSQNKRRLALQVDLEELEVSLAALPGDLYRISDDRYPRYLSYAGELLHVSNALGHFSAGRARRPKLVDQARLGVQGFVRVGDAVYLPGEGGWLSLDLETSTVEDIAAGERRIPSNVYQRPTYAHSAHYGIIGFRAYGASLGQRLLRLHIEPVSNVTTESVPQIARVEAPRTDDPTPATERSFPLTADERRRIVETVQQLLDDGHRVAANAQVLYSDGLTSCDNWLAGPRVDKTWLDPPLERKGYRLFVEDGRVMRIDSVETESPPRRFWYNASGAPVLAAADTWYQFGEYDDRGVLARVTKLKEDFSVDSITVFQNTLDYHSGEVFRCRADGKCYGSTRFQGVDDKGQPVSADAPELIAFSKRYEQVTAPRRIGLMSFYPIPSEANDGNE